MIDLPPPPSFPADFENVRGGDGRPRVAQCRASGHWWWIDPADCPQVVCGVHGLDSNIGSRPADRQVASWGFNLLLPPFAEGFQQGVVPHLRDLELRRAGGALIREEGVLLPDVFDPAWVEAVEQIFNGVVPSPMLAGWLSDGELRWGGVVAEDGIRRRPSLLQVCLGLDPAYRAYHSAWEFTLARHGGELDQMARAWGVELSSRGSARQFTRDEVVLDSTAFGSDSDAFTREFTQRYFGTVRQAAQKVNAGCLLFSPPVSASTPASVGEVAASHTDVVLTAADTPPAGPGPKILIEVNWPSGELAPDVLSGESGLEVMIREGRKALVDRLQHPDIVGYAWSPFRRGDLATTDPADAGLLDDNGRTNPVYAQPLAALNQAARGIREQATGCAAMEAAR